MHWNEWLIWRNFGKRGQDGIFEPSVSYVEAIQSIPEETLDVFLKLDNVYAKMESQYIKQTSKRGNQ
jgi:hypothetical protein